MKKLVNKYFAAALISIASISLIASKTDDRLFELAKNLDIFASLFKEVNSLYVDEINPTKAIRTGIDAMLKELDPYTNFYTEDAIEDYRTLTTGKYNGIGASVVQLNGQRVISMIFEDSPAQAAGLKIGDIVLKINNIAIQNRTDDEIGRLLKGQTGTTATLTIQRVTDKKPFEVKVARGIVKTPNVPHYGMLSADVGYVQLKDFSQTAAQEVKAAMEDLKDQGMKNLVLDLRSNPGGLLVQAVEIVNFFVPKGQLVVETKGKVAEWNTKYLTTQLPFDESIPVAVLLNSKSASASEIVAGALQDYDRAVLIGQRSFGKGLVQVTRPLTYNTQVKITTAKYYIPSGRCIQAIDYSHRNEDGSVGKIPDSLKTAFRTRNGRQFYDGGGVEPDIATPEANLSELTKALIKEGIIFNYATTYYYANPTKKIEGLFSLSDTEYQHFTQWLKTQTFNYTTPLEKHLAAAEAAAKEENTFASLSQQFSTMRATIQQQKQQELERAKQEIKEQLALEIVGRYNFQKAAKFISFEKDKEIQTALSLFKDMPRYQKIVAKQ